MFRQWLLAGILLDWALAGTMQASVLGGTLSAGVQAFQAQVLGWASAPERAGAAWAGIILVWVRASASVLARVWGRVSVSVLAGEGLPVSVSVGVSAPALRRFRR